MFISNQENNTVRNILNKIYTLESQKKRCRSNSEMRDVSSIRKKQRGLLVEFQKERERQKRFVCFKILSELRVLFDTLSNISFLYSLFLYFKVLNSVKFPCDT